MRSGPSGIGCSPKQAAQAMSDLPHPMSDPPRAEYLPLDPDEELEDERTWEEDRELLGTGRAKSPASSVAPRARWRGETVRRERSFTHWTVSTLIHDLS